jgi:hypothetical protein
MDIHQVGVLWGKTPLDTPVDEAVKKSTVDGYEPAHGVFILFLC